MKVYVLISHSYDYHDFPTIEGVYRSVDEMSELMTEKDPPMFKEGSPELAQFEKDTFLDGFTHYTYQEYDI